VKRGKLNRYLLEDWQVFALIAVAIAIMVSG
jgi:hypothetical protein